MHMFPIACLRVHVCVRWREGWGAISMNARMIIIVWKNLRCHYILITLTNAFCWRCGSPNHEGFQNKYKFGFQPNFTLIANKQTKGTINSTKKKKKNKEKLIKMKTSFVLKKRIVFAVPSSKERSTCVHQELFCCFSSFHSVYSVRICYLVFFLYISMHWSTQEVGWH